jgi:hypothetical protein
VKTLDELVQKRDLQRGEDFVLLEARGLAMGAKLRLDSAGTLSEFRDSLRSSIYMKQLWNRGDRHRKGRLEEQGLGVEGLGAWDGRAFSAGPFPQRWNIPPSLSLGAVQTVVKPESDSESQEI